MTDHVRGGQASCWPKKSSNQVDGTYEKYGTEYHLIKRSCTYTPWDLRRDLKSAKGRWRAVILQIWSRLNPDTSFQLVKVADIGAYVGGLLRSCDRGTFRMPPARAMQRRSLARLDRRRVVGEARREALKKTQNDRYMEEQIRALAKRAQAPTGKESAPLSGECRTASKADSC